jgi:hypothetical protein
MHVWWGDPWSVEELSATPGIGITDENIAESMPFVRALIVQRLEQAWRACDPHIQVQVNPDTGLVMRPDPRFIEAGIRIIDRLGDIYRIRTPQTSNMLTDEGLEPVRAQVRAQIEAMEARMKGQD